MRVALFRWARMLFESVELAELARTEKQIQERQGSRVGDLDAWHFGVLPFLKARTLILEIKYFTQIELHIVDYSICFCFSIFQKFDSRCSMRNILRCYFISVQPAKTASNCRAKKKKYSTITSYFSLVESTLHSVWDIPREYRLDPTLKSSGLHSIVVQGKTIIHSMQTVYTHAPLVSY